MSARSMTSRIRLHSDKIKDPTSASVRSELPANAEGEPYICRFPDTEDSDVELEELPEIPGLYLAKMGAFKGNVRMCVYGTEMDVCKTNAGVKALKYWKTDPLEIALYERPDPKQPVLKLVGVYPVVDGYAQLKLEELQGKAQTGKQALHVFPGGQLNKLLGLGWPLSKAVE